MSEKTKIGVAREPDGTYFASDEIGIAIAVANGAEIVLEPRAYAVTDTVSVRREGGAVTLRYTNAEGDLVEVEAGMPVKGLSEPQ